MHRKLKGIVIKETQQGENNKLLTLLTETEGVITVNARGVKSILASNLKSAQLFAFSNLLLYEKRGFFTLVDAELIENFYSLRDDMDAFTLASYCCEVAGSVAIKGEENATLLQLLLNTLYVVSKKLVDLRHAKAVFEFRLACELGFAPEVDCCGCCGEDNDPEIVALDLQNGIFLCDACFDTPGTTGTYVVRITKTLSDALRYIQTAKSTKIFSFTIKDIHLPELVYIAENYLHLRLEKQYNTLKVLKEIMNY